MVNVVADEAAEAGREAGRGKGGSDIVGCRNVDHRPLLMPPA